MKPDSFTSQLQTVLTAFYEDIMGVQGASGCPKSKVVKRKFEDQEDAGLAPDAATTPADAATPPPPPRRTGARQPPARRSLAPSPSLSRAGALAGGREGVLKGSHEADADY